MRLCTEVDLKKPLLSKFRLNGRISKIQYEGLRMICFCCGKHGQREENYPLRMHVAEADANVEHPDQANSKETEQLENQMTCGSWTMVQKPRRKNMKQGQGTTCANTVVIEGVAQHTDMQSLRGRALHQESDGTSHLDLEHRMVDASQHLQRRNKGTTTGWRRRP